MSFDLSVKMDVKRLTKHLRGVQREAIPRATARALNTTARQVQSQAVKALSKKTGLKQKDIRVAMSRKKASWRNLLSAVIATGRAVNLIRFVTPAKRHSRAFLKRDGVIAKAWGKKKLYKGTFIGNRGRTVFARKGKERLPIKAIHGPSIPREMARPVIDRLLKKTIRKKFPINFERDMKFYLSRIK